MRLKEQNEPFVKKNGALFRQKPNRLARREVKSAEHDDCRYVIRKG